MTRVTAALSVALLLVFAGCLGPTDGTDATTTDGPAESLTETVTKTPTATDTTTPTDTSTATATPVSVSYSISAGEIPENFKSMYVTFQVVFVEQSGDIPACWRDTYHGPYKPTPTPLKTPSGECHRSNPITVNLTALDSPRTFEAFTAPGRFDAGHGLIVTQISATYDNGTQVSGIRGTGGYRANVVEGRPSGSYRLRFGVDAYEDRWYDYWLTADTESPE
jgi:hypothetical protein